jgi:hypothetical protein
MMYCTLGRSGSRARARQVRASWRTFLEEMALAADEVR